MIERPNRRSAYQCGVTRTEKLGKRELDMTCLLLVALYRHNSDQHYRRRHDGDHYIIVIGRWPLCYDTAADAVLIMGYVADEIRNRRDALLWL